MQAFIFGNTNFQDFFLLSPKWQAQGDKLLDQLLQLSAEELDNSWKTRGTLF